MAISSSIEYSITLVCTCTTETRAAREMRVDCRVSRALNFVRLLAAGDPSTAALPRREDAWGVADPPHALGAAAATATGALGRDEWPLAPSLRKVPQPRRGAFCAVEHDRFIAERAVRVDRVLRMHMEQPRASQDL